MLLFVFSYNENAMACMQEGSFVLIRVENDNLHIPRQNLSSPTIPTHIQHMSAKMDLEVAQHTRMTCNIGAHM